VPGEQEPHVGQHLEMGGNGGLADVDGRHDVAHTHWHDPAGGQRGDLDPGGLSQGLNQVAYPAAVGRSTGLASSSIAHRR
jgi:hypothetical protein